MVAPGGVLRTAFRDFVATLPGMEPAIVPIAMHHVESFRECLDGIAREKKYLVFLEAPPPETVREWVRACMEAGNPQFVAVDGGAVVGWCDVTRKTREPLRHSGTLGMGLAPAYRGKGLGRRLMEAALEASRREGFERVDLFVFASNANAIRLYESMGFVREGVRRKFAKIDGEWMDALDMAWFP